jgi:hypothetical protein
MRAANSVHRMCPREKRVARVGVRAGLAAASLLAARAWAGQENLASAADAEASSADRTSRVAPNYALEERFLPDQVGKLVFDLAVTPHWFGESDRFWYSYETPEGTRYYLVDPGTEGQGSVVGQREGGGGTLAADQFSV